MCGCAKKLCCVHDLRCVRLVIAFATAVALAGCTSDGTPPSTGDSGTGSGFMRNLFSSKSEDQPPVPHNEVPSVAHSETPVEPPRRRRNLSSPNNPRWRSREYRRKRRVPSRRALPKARLLRSVARHRSLLREASITASALAVKQTS